MSSRPTTVPTGQRRRREGNLTIHRFRSLRLFLFRKRSVSQQMHSLNRAFHMLVHDAM